MDIVGKTNVASDAPDLNLGEVFNYGEDFDTPTEGAYLASVRAEEIKCREKVFSGKSFSPGLATGFTFTLDKFYQSTSNISYLVITSYSIHYTKLYERRSAASG